MQKKDGQHRDEPVEERNGSVCHRNAGELGDEQRYYEFERLHFPDLPFAHQPHHGEQGYEDDGRPQNDQSHIRSMPRARRIYTESVSKQLRL